MIFTFQQRFGIWQDASFDGECYSRVAEQTNKRDKVLLANETRVQVHNLGIIIVHLLCSIHPRRVLHRLAPIANIFLFRQGMRRSHKSLGRHVVIEIGQKIIVQLPDHVRRYSPHFFDALVGLVENIVKRVQVEES